MEPKDLMKFPRESSTLVGWAYKKEEKELYIGFANKSGMKTYMYKGVPEEVVNGLLDAESHGKYFHAHIKENYETIAL